MGAQQESRRRGSVEMTGLRQLHKSMRAAGRLRVQFGYRNNGKTDFAVVFLADEDPYQLMIAARRGSFGAVLDVRPGYRVEPWIEDVGALFDALGISHGRGKFSLTEFLKDVDRQAPETVKGCARPEPERVARMRPGFDEAEKVYFMHFMENHEGRRPTRANLEKTRTLIGEDVRQKCEEQRMSTCWSADPEDKREVPSLDWSGRGYQSQGGSESSGM